MYILYAKKHFSRLHCNYPRENQKIQEAQNFETSDSREDVQCGNNVQPVALIPILRQINFFGEGGGGGELAKVTRP